MKLNEKLVELRKAKGLTQQEAAEALNVSRQAVSRWEVGTAEPSLDNMALLSKLYGVPLVELIQEETIEPAESPADAPAAVPARAGRPYAAPLCAFLAVLILGVGILIGLNLQKEPGSVISMFMFSPASQTEEPPAMPSDSSEPDEQPTEDGQPPENDQLTKDLHYTPGPDVLETPDISEEEKTDFERSTDFVSSFTLNGLMRRNGEWVQGSVEFTKKADGSWHATKFNDTLLEASETGKSGASQSPNYDTYEPTTVSRKKLTDQELSDLAGRYDPRNITQAQYDAFLDELVEKGVLTREDTTWLGYHGLTRLDVDMDELAEQAATGKLMGGVVGTAYVTSLDDGRGKPPVWSLEEAEGDLIRWLESMMEQKDQWTGPSTRERKAALDALYNVVRRM